jgi:hypothetical protein
MKWRGRGVDVTKGLEKSTNGRIQLLGKMDFGFDEFGFG